VALTDDDVRDILRMIDGSALQELRIETEGFSLHVTKSAPGPASPAPPAVADPQGAGIAIDAPMLGTFYRAESPTDRPFVDIGDHVTAETVVGLIEVMKLMNTVQAGVAGTVIEVLAENAKLVEYGQPIFRVAPDE
jgi:acetyl-CoA carboxylase biotin carboxyl carrier protein